MRRRESLSCQHVTGDAVEPLTDACGDCGSRFSLRVCVECGYVGCCESQHGHNTQHFRETGHPVIKSLPLGASSFTWCYRCHRYV